MTGSQSASSARSWRQATVLAFTAMACGVLLGGLSAWFLGAVAIAGLSAATALSFNFFAPGALVRLFAVGRTAARYGERLVGHKAALADQVRHRVRLFSAMAGGSGVRRAGWQLGDQSRLADYLDDVEDIDTARLRAGLPSMTLACGILGCLGATAVVAPLALVPIILLLLMALLIARRAATAGAMAWERVRSERRRGARRLGTALASAVPLQAEGAWSAECTAGLLALREADAAALALRRLQAGLDALGAALGPIAGLSVIAAAWLGGARGDMLLFPVFVGFAWLALGEPMNGISRILIATLRRQAAEAATEPCDRAAPIARPASLPDELTGFRSASLQRRAPEGRPIGTPVAFQAEIGRPTVLVGVSGSGKTSLLKQIAGWIGDDVLFCGRDALEPADRQALSTLCLHDAAILDDTVRANLFGGAASDAQLWEALEAVELADRMSEAGGLGGWIRQDMLSLGEAQRLNLARLWLAARPLVLIDEPTEHLDDEQAARILKRLLARLEGHIVVMCSHRRIDLPDTNRIELRS